MQTLQKILRKDLIDKNMKGSIPIGSAENYKSKNGGIG